MVGKEDEQGEEDFSIAVFDGSICSLLRTKHASAINIRNYAKVPVGGGETGYLSTRRF